LVTSFVDAFHLSKKVWMVTRWSLKHLEFEFGLF
jgi:hypothetical protein